MRIDLFYPEQLTILTQIILIDLVLAGDNAIIIGMVASKFPIEQRIYPNGSKGMNWHIDTLMYDKPQYEAVYTIRIVTKTSLTFIQSRYINVWFSCSM